MLVLDNLVKPCVKIKVVMSPFKAIMKNDDSAKQQKTMTSSQNHLL